MTIVRFPPADSFLQRAHHLSFHGCVQCRRCLVCQYNGRVLQQDASDRNPLLLPTRELRAPFANERLVAIWELNDGVVNVRPARRANYFIFACIWLPVTNVVHDRVVETGPCPAAPRQCTCARMVAAPPRCPGRPRISSQLAGRRSGTTSGRAWTCRSQKGQQCQRTSHRAIRKLRWSNTGVPSGHW